VLRLGFPPDGIIGAEKLGAEVLGAGELGAEVLVAGELGAGEVLGAENSGVKSRVPDGESWASRGRTRRARERFRMRRGRMPAS
jgi:hypothetical protein